jgi:hypothetical protein
LVQNVLHLVGCGSLGDDQAFANLAIREALGDEHGNLPLTCGEQVTPGLETPVGGLEEAFRMVTSASATASSSERCAPRRPPAVEGLSCRPL